MTKTIKTCDVCGRELDSSEKFYNYRCLKRMGGNEKCLSNCNKYFGIMYVDEIAYNNYKVREVNILDGQDICKECAEELNDELVILFNNFLKKKRIGRR